MSAVLEVPKVRLLRPLLKFPKSYLRSYLYNRNIPFIEDPSNNNPKYSRALLRQQELTSQEQIRANNLVKYYAKRRIQTENNVHEIVSQHITVFPEGYGLLEKSYYQALSSEHQLKILQRCIMTFGVGKYPPKRASLFCLKEKIGLTCTLHGCLIFNWGSYIGFARESEAIKEDFLLGLVKEVRWDDRFNISFRKSYQKMRVRALKEKGWEQLKKIPEGKILSSLPHPVRLSLPGLWEENHLICPLIPFASKFTRREEYVISFSPRYPLTRFTFTIV
jgi:tRNA(Ile)-lysidine synthase